MEYRDWVFKINNIVTKVIDQLLANFQNMSSNSEINKRNTKIKNDTRI